MEIKINDRISYIPQEESPLSSDIVIVRGDSGMFIFDVGNNDRATEYLNSISAYKTVILSHFHSDHTAKLEDTIYDELYVGSRTYKSVRAGVTVNAPVILEDGVKIEIIPIPSTHAKGSLALVVDDEIVFTGDATYSMWKDGKVLYNAQLLKEEIDLLEKIKAEKCFLSHGSGKIRSKHCVLTLLKNIYTKRTKDDPYIVVGLKEKRD